MVLITKKNSWGWGGSSWWITETSVNTLTNKTLDDYTNFIHADGIHLRVKATEALAKWDVIKFVWFNAWEQAIEVAKRDDLNVPAIWVVYTVMSTWDFGMAVSNGLFKGIDTSAFNVWDILYPDNTGWFTATNPWGYAQQLAYVVRSHAINGEIMLNVWPVYSWAWSNPSQVDDIYNWFIYYAHIWEWEEQISRYDIDTCTRMIAIWIWDDRYTLTYVLPVT